MSAITADWNRNHMHNITGEINGKPVPCTGLTHCPSVCDCESDNCYVNATENNDTAAPVTPNNTDCTCNAYYFGYATHDDNCDENGVGSRFL